ncbi:MAG: dihydrodipicolinate synthase family protein [Bacillota bacterium]
MIIKVISVNHKWNLYNKLHIFNGHDENFLGGLAMGADGAIGSTYNIMADKFIEIQKLFNEGKMEKARKIQIEANDIIDVLIEVGVKQGVKYLIEKEYGFTCGGCRQPFKGLDSSGIQILESLSD